MYAKKRPRTTIVVNVKWRTVQMYTLMQVCIAGCIFGVAQFSAVGYIFPVLVVILIPFRLFVVSRFFKDEDLIYLDPIGETEEEAHDEKAKYLEHKPSIDEAEADALPGFSDFHAVGMLHDIAEKTSHDAEEAASESTLNRRHQAANTEDNVT